jgi:hypothetical protein
MAWIRRGWTLLALLAVPFACDSGGVERCGEIPSDGCPVGRGGTCDDPYCGALYNCIDGRWALATTCEGFGPGGAGGGGGSGGTPGSGGCQNVVIDKTGESTGCTPDLALPDCAAVAAESCHPCTTGCADFFLCTDQGWEAVAFCDQDGQVVLEP